MKMINKIKLLLVIFVFGAFGLLFGQVLWPASPTFPFASTDQASYFIPLYIVEAVMFGAGIAFAIFVFPLMKNAVGHIRIHLWLVYVSTIWLFVSWWPHERLHLFVGTDFQGTLYVDYGFHLTVILVSFTLAFSFVKIILELQRSGKK